MKLYYLLIQLLLLASRKLKTIIPKPGIPIELKINNQNIVSDYTFHFYLEEDSLDGNKFIKFRL